MPARSPLSYAAGVPTPPLVDDAYFKVTHDPTRRLVIAVRSAEAIDDLTDLERSVSAVAAAFDAVGREGTRLFIDIRAARGRNDASFEEAMKRLRPRLFGGFERVALLVRSAVGLLQIQRHLREDGVSAHVDTDEAALMAALLAD